MEIAKTVDFSKVKTTAEGGLYAEYKETTQKEEQTFGVHVTKKSEEKVHPDLEQSADELKDHVMSILGLKKDRADKIEVTGVSISGTDNAEGVIITSKMACDGGTVALNTPRIRIGTDAAGEYTGTYKDEQKVAELVDAFIQEARKYLFEGKRAQLQIAFPDGESEEKEQVAKTG